MRNFTVYIKRYFLIVAFLLVLLVGYSDILPRALTKAQRIFQGNTGYWSVNSPSMEYFNKIKLVTTNEMHKPFVSPGTQDGSYRLQKCGFWYPTALLADSLESCHKFFGTKSDLESLIKFYDKYLDYNGNFKDPQTVKYLGNAMHGNTLIYLEQVTNDKKYLKAINNIYLFLRLYPKTESGILPYRRNTSKLILVDSLGMVCPFLSRYGRTYDEPKATKLAELQMIDFINNGVDASTGLPNHGYTVDGGAYVGILGWGRGTGWYLYGLVGMLEYLPIENSSRKQMVIALEKIAKTLEHYQKTDGSWPWSITNPYACSEMSGTAMIAYSIEKAIRLGLLPESYYKMLDRAYAALLSKTTDKGYLIGASGDCEGVGEYSSTYGHCSWVQGPATAFTSLKLKREEMQ